MSAVFLDTEELEELTNKQRYTAQRKVLNALGITHKTRPDGSLLVLRSHVEKLLGGDVESKKAKKAKEPNWGAMNA